MIDEYGYNATPLDTNNAEKKHWSVRAREGLHKTLDFVAEHGATVGMAGGAILCMGAGTCAIIGNASPSGIYAQEWFDSSGSLAFAALVGMGGALFAEEAARAFLKKDDGDEVFGQVGEKVPSPPLLKGAVPIANDPTLGPKFQEAIRHTLLSLEDKPEAKKALVNLLKKSPEAREAFANRIAGGQQNFSESISLYQVETEDTQNTNLKTTPSPR